MVQSVLRKYLKKYFLYISLSLLFSVITSYLNLQLPRILENIVNNVVLAQAWEKLGEILWYLILIFFFSGLFGMARTFITQFIGTRVVYEIRDDIYRALQSHSFRFYDKNRTGDLMSKTTTDVHITRHFLSEDFANFVRDIIVLIIILWMVFSINVQLSFIFLLLIPVMFFLVIWYRKNMYPAFLDMSNKHGELSSILQENVTGVRVVKAFAREDQQISIFNKSNQAYLNAHLKVNRIATTFGPLQELITMCGSVLLLLIGGYFVLNNQLNLGEAISFFAFFAYLYDPIKNLALIISKYSQVEAAMTRINTILAYPDEIKERPNPVILPRINGKVQFTDIWFCYDPVKCDDDFVLKNINLTVEPGERIAILGATGAGKSSLINLIPRFYDPSRGKIIVDGIDLKDLKLDEFRRQIGIVSQDIFLFSRSIKDNIAFGNKKVSQEEIEKVAKIAAIHNFIISLPDGYKTMVGERGQTLSGGQKQRVAIARALLLKPRILILDDSLSAVDIDTEVQIQQALEQLEQNATTFVITQRISTIQNCNRILVLDRGQITELGTHTELYAQNGIYTKIYNTMFKTQTEAPVKPLAPVMPEAISQILVPEGFPPLPPEDITKVKEFYDANYPNEEEILKAEQKTLKRITKDQEPHEEEPVKEDK